MKQKEKFSNRSLDFLQNIPEENLTEILIECVKENEE